MLEGIKGLFKDVSFSVDQRIRNPYWFSFLILIIYYNWQGLLVLININDFKSIKEKQEAIDSIEYHLVKPVLLAFVGVLAFYIVQYLGLIISIFFQDRLKPNLLAVISSKRFASVEKVAGLRAMISTLSIEKSELETQLSGFRSQSEIELTKLSSTISQLTIENSESKKELDKITSDQKELIDVNSRLNNEIQELEKKLVDFEIKNKKLEAQDISLMDSDRWKLNTYKNLFERLNKGKKKEIGLLEIVPFMESLDKFVVSFVNSEFNSAHLIFGKTGKTDNISKEKWIKRLQNNLARILFIKEPNDLNFSNILVSLDVLVETLDFQIKPIFSRTFELEVEQSIRDNLYLSFRNALVIKIGVFSSELKASILKNYVSPSI